MEQSLLNGGGGGVCVYERDAETPSRSYLLAVGRSWGLEESNDLFSAL